MKHLLSILILLGLMSVANANECPNGGMPMPLEDGSTLCIPEGVKFDCFINVYKGEEKCIPYTMLSVNFLLDKNYSIIDISDSLDGLLKIYTLKKSDDLFVCRVNTVSKTTVCMKP